MVLLESRDLNVHDDDRNARKWWSAWRLRTSAGRQRWELSEDVVSAANGEEWLREMEGAFRFDARRNPNSADRVFRDGQGAWVDELCEPPTTDLTSRSRSGLERAGRRLAALQVEDGHFPGDYGGPLFLLPGLIITAHITATPFPAPHVALMKRYMLNHQNEDGGWGLHIEGESTMFGTVLQYVALRLLGVSASELLDARAWIHQRGGATWTPPWGKFYLSVLGAYDWTGNDSLLPEMWLLPRWLPVHPSRYWCHARMVYLPMSYCFGHRITGQEDDVVRALRAELYPEDYETVDWSAARQRIAPEDRFVPPSRLQSTLFALLNLYEKRPSPQLRARALDFVLRYVEAEDEQTSFVDIGPVNQVLNSLCVWHAHGRDSSKFQRHVERWYDYLWLAEDGLKMSGYNGSQLWDTAFGMQALLEGGIAQATVAAAYGYLEMTQVQREAPKQTTFYRHPSVGGWPFSTREHGWPISDCTAEGLSAALAYHEAYGPGPIDAPRLEQAVDVILSLQNVDGGWATYELQRGPPWLERLNPSGIFGQIMVDYPWVECTAACLRALAHFRRRHPGYRSSELERSVVQGAEYLRRAQRSDGSFMGSWAVCFTYGTWFGVEGLLAAGARGCDSRSGPSPEVRRACRFLLELQREDGGWGESYRSCIRGTHVPHERSQVVQTAWALLALMAARFSDRGPIDRGIELLLKRQEANGDWPQEGISGVFNRTCMITYSNYRNIFPLWALARYSDLVSDRGAKHDA